MQIVVVLLLAVGLFAAGASVGWRSAQNSRDAQELAEGKAKAESLMAAAQEIAKIKVVQQRITQQAETVIRENTVYKDCKLDPVAKGLLNQAASGAQP